MLLNKRKRWADLRNGSVGQARSSGQRFSAWLVVGMAVLGSPTPLLAQEAQALPPTRDLPFHSKVDVSTLPPAKAPGQGAAGIAVKPFLTRDADGLRRWRELIERSPEVLPPAPGFVEDKKSAR
jgi:hypothetical protein